jgi:hypothetical protein
MKMFVVASACLGLAVGLRADPAAALQQAVDAFLRAGSYSWRESRTRDFNGRITSLPYAFGRTVVDGFTIATVFSPSLDGFSGYPTSKARNVRAIFLGQRTAFELATGWRRYEEMTPEELQELFGLSHPLPPRSPLPNSPLRTYNHTSLHDALRVLLPFTTSIGEEDGAIVGTLGSSKLDAQRFEAFMRSGQVPPMPQTWGMQIWPLRDPAPLIKQATASFKAWVVDGKLSKIEFAFAVDSTMFDRINEPRKIITMTVYSIELQEVGTTQVNITPEMRALFNDATVVR